MPGKNFKRPDPRNSKKGRKTRGNSAPVPPSNPTSKMSNKPPSSSSGAQTRGRRTNNSQKGRPSLPAAANKPPPVSAAPPNSKKNGGSNGKGGPGSSMKSKKKTPDYSFYTAEDQTIYKPGGKGDREINGSMGREGERKKEVYIYMYILCKTTRIVLWIYGLCTCTCYARLSNCVQSFAFYSKTYQTLLLLLLSSSSPMFGCTSLLHNRALNTHYH